MINHVRQIYLLSTDRETCQKASDKNVREACTNEAYAYCRCPWDSSIYRIEKKKDYEERSSTFITVLENFHDNGKLNLENLWWFVSIIEPSSIAEDLLAKLGFNVERESIDFVWGNIEMMRKLILNEH